MFSEGRQRVASGCIYREGISAINRWLNDATPPDLVPHPSSTMKGSRQVGRDHFRVVVRLTTGTPRLRFAVRGCWLRSLRDRIGAAAFCRTFGTHDY